MTGNDERMKRRQATRDAILDVEREALELEEDVITGQHDVEELKKQGRQPLLVHLPAKPSSSPPSVRKRQAHWAGIAAVIVALGSSGIIAQACHGPAGAR